MGDEENIQPGDDRLPEYYCAKCTGVLFEESEQCDECGSPRPPEGWSSTKDGHDAWLGRVLDGRYLVTKRVGQGATGNVYRVSSMAIRRDFAIKIINFRHNASGGGPEQIRARLTREIDALSRLRNPHVVPFYEVIELYDDFVGIVMDFVSGRTLESIVRHDDAMEPKRALRLLRQVANGLHEAHEAGMIHRDLKPENLMVERMPAGDDFVHILDFGIVRLEGGVSMTQGFLGTPLYASPEQAMAGEVDRRSDIYSLGAIFFFMLTGRAPFNSENVYDILRSHVRTPVPELSEVVPDRSFPQGVETLLGEMMAKSPEARPPDLSEVIERTDRLLKATRHQKNATTGVSSSSLDPVRDDRRTGPHDAIDTDEGNRDGFEEKTDGENEFIASRERDKTGPKAAIFRRNPSRNSVKSLVEESRREVHDISPDRVLNSDSGKFALGTHFHEGIQHCAPGHAGATVVWTNKGDVYRVEDGDKQLVASKQTQLECLAASQQWVFWGSKDGIITRTSEREVAERLFQDVRRTPINAIGTSPDDSLWLAGSDSGRVYMARPARDPQNWSRIQDGPPVVALSVDDDGSNFAVARKHREIEVFSTSNPKTPATRFSVPDVPKSMAFSTDGHILAMVLGDNSVHLYSPMNGRRIVVIKDMVHPLAGLAFNTDNELVGYFASEKAVFGLDLQRQLRRARSS